MNESAPLVSIIIPVQNKQKCLHKCLRSLRNQTYTNIEVILVDNCSTDSSLLKTKRTLEDRFETLIVHNTTNESHLKSRYVGIANAHGRFITFMEAYDRIEPRAIEVMVHAMLDFNAHLVQLRTPRRFFKVLGNKYQDEFEPDMASRLIEGDEFRTLASYVGMDSYINPSCRGKLYITSKLLDASNMDFKLIWGEDQIFNIQYLRECRSMVFCDYIGYNYRREHTSARNYKYSALREYKNIHQLKRMLGQDEECINSEIKMLLRYHLRALITELGYTGQAVEMILEDELRDPLWRSVGETSTPTQLVEEAMNYIQRNPVRYIKKRLLK